MADGDDLQTVTISAARPTQPSVSPLQSSSSLDPQIAASQKTEREAAAASVAAAQEEATAAKTMAEKEMAQDAELNDWIANTPTRQAAYATAMHAAPILAILTALGGKATKLNGYAMMGAMNGLMSGLNSGAEAQYNDAMTAWQGAFTRLKAHQEQLHRAHQLMLEAYAGRADADQKAFMAASRMTGELLDEKQMQISERVNLMKIRVEQMDKLERLNLAFQMNDIRMRNEMEHERHNRELEDIARQKGISNTPEFQALKQRLASIKNDENNLYKERAQLQQLGSPYSTDEVVKRQTDIQQRLQDKQLETDEILARMDALVNAAPGSRPTHGVGGNWGTAQSNTGQLPTLTPQQAADPNVPKGTQFLGTDGNTYTKN